MARTATKPKRKTIRVAIYIRYSTDKQDTSEARQIREISEWLKGRKNYKVVATYKDLGVSGDATEKRYQFKSMMQAAVEGEFERIIAFDMSRIGRFDSLEAGRWFAPLRDANVIIETTTDGEVDWHSLSGRIVSAVEAEAKNDLVRRNSQATVTGQTRKAVEGHGYPGGPTPFGYRRVFQEINGKPVGVLEVDKQNAAVVQRIFELYTQPHGTLRSVSKQLNAEGVPSAKGGKWRKNTVGRILENPIYNGTYQWGKRQTGRYYTRDGESGLQERRKSDPVTYTKPITHKNKIPRIISDELWEETKRLMKDRRKETMAPAVRKPLSGLVYCDDCGGVMRADGDYFRCKNSDSDNGGTCPSYRMPAGDLLKGALAAIKDQVSKPETRRQLQVELERAVGRRKGDDQAARDLAKRLKQLELEIKRGADRLVKLPDSLVDDLTAHLEGLAVQRDKVREDLEALENRSTGKTGSKARVSKVITNMDAILKACGRGTGDPVVVNGLLKSAGVSLKVTPTPAVERRKGRSKGFVEVCVPLVLIVATLVSNRHTGKMQMKRRCHKRIPFSW